MKALSLILICALCVAIGCASESDQSSGTPSGSGDSESTSQAADHSSGAASGDMVTLVGTSGCGHCNFHKGESCSAAMKTADGNIYILDGVDHDSEMFQKRMDGIQVKVTGVVAERAGDNHVTVHSLEML